MTTQAKPGVVSLQFVWAYRLRLKAEGDKYWKWKDNHWGDTLRVLADKLWGEAIQEAYGNITLTWEKVPEKDDYRCTLSTGEVFEP